MKQLNLSIIAICIAFISVGFTSSTHNEIEKETTTLNVSVGSDFCDGWDDGYQAALEGCLKVAITPICPIAPIGKNSYKHGYGMGYGKAQAKHCD